MLGQGTATFTTVAVLRRCVSLLPLLSQLDVDHLLPDHHRQHRSASFVLNATEHRQADAQQQRLYSGREHAASPDRRKRDHVGRWSWHLSWLYQFARENRRTVQARSFYQQRVSVHAVMLFAQVLITVRRAGNTCSTLEI